MTKIEEFLNEVCDVLGREPGSIQLSDTPATIEEWDSVGHLSIISTVDEFLGVPVDDQEMQNFDSIAQLVERLKARGALDA